MIEKSDTYRYSSADWAELLAKTPETPTHEHDLVLQEEWTRAPASFKRFKCKCGTTWIQRFEDGELVKTKVLPPVVRGRLHPVDQEELFPKRYDPEE